MRKSYLNLLFVFFLFWLGCQDDDNVTSYNHSYKLLGSWEYISGTNMYWPSLKYLVIKPDNNYHFLTEESFSHNIIDGVYSIKDNQINMGEMGIFIYTFTGDTLTLTKAEYTLTFVTTQSAITETEWLIPVTIEKVVQLPDSLWIYDIAFDGSYFWVTDTDTVVKIDTMGNIISGISISVPQGIAYGNGYLWISSHDTLKQVNPVNGQVILSRKVQQASVIQILGLLTYGDDYIWSKGRYWNFKIRAETGEVVDTFSYPSDGIEFQDNKLWTIHSTEIYAIDPETGIIRYYHLPPNNLGFTKLLVFDGKGFWITALQNGVDHWVMIKLKMPL